MVEVWDEFLEWAAKNPFWGFIARGVVNALMLCAAWGVLAYSRVSNHEPLPTEPFWLVLGCIFWIIFQFVKKSKYIGSGTSAREAEQEQSRTSSTPTQSGGDGADGQGGGAADGD